MKNRTSIKKEIESRYIINSHNQVLFQQRNERRLCLLAEALRVINKVYSTFLQNIPWISGSLYNDRKLVLLN